MVQLTRLLLANSGLKKFMYNLSGFNKYGLMRDDILYETPIVKEALKRLPEKLVDERNYRLIRAIQCSLTHTYLPKDQWVKFEEDVKYLSPYIIQVEKELKEREQWEITH